MLRFNALHGAKVRINGSLVGILLTEWANGTATIQNIITGAQTLTPYVTTCVREA